MTKSILEYAERLIARLRDRVANHEIRHSTLQAIPFWIAAAIAALVAVAYAKRFAWTEAMSIGFSGSKRPPSRS